MGNSITLVVLSATDLTAAAAFYSTVFGWQMLGVTPEVTAAIPPGGPSISLRATTADGFPGTVPFIGVADVAAALRRVVDAGGAVEREPWTVPMAGTFARFEDRSGTIYGLTSGLPPGALPRVPPPFGANPRPPAATICSLEMYAADRAETGRFFHEIFGWESHETMPAYTAFDPGAGIGGVFQSHTPSLPAVAYIYVADVGDTLQRVEAAGGRRSGDPAEIPGLARFGYFKDPSGTDVGLISA